MNIEVDEQLYLPKVNDSIISSPFGGMKVSFVMLLILVVGVYIAIFIVLNNVDTANKSASYIVLLIEVILWFVLIYVVYINIKSNSDDNLDFQAKMENLFNTKISELTVNADTNKDSSDKKRKIANVKLKTTMVKKYFI